MKEAKFAAGLDDGDALPFGDEAIKTIDLAYGWSAAIKQTKRPPNHELLQLTPSKQREPNRKPQ